MEVGEMSSELSRRSFLKLGAATAGGLLAARSATAAAQTLRRSAAAAGTAKRGGHLTVGMITGGQTESINPAHSLYNIDHARIRATFDRLLETLPDGRGSVPMLAEEAAPNHDRTVWRLKLRHGVTFHNGKTMTAEDVLYTISRWRSPEHYANSIIGKDIRFNGLRKIGAYEVELPFKRPYPELAPYLSQQMCCIIQKGATNFSKPVGTGPFEVTSFQAGHQSVHARNPNYFLHGEPYLDGLTFISFADAASKLNALLGGQINVTDALNFAQAKAMQSSSQAKLLLTHQPGPLPFTMRVDRPPFNDVRVRQAMRLIADRPALIKDALNGFGTVGNDIPGRGLPYYDSSLPQRHQDIEQAKHLLKKAGQSNLKVTLQTSNIFPGTVEAATLFAQQAAAAGVKIAIQQEPTSAYWNPQQLYTKMTFAQDLVSPIASLMAVYLENLVSTGTYNETHWGSPGWDTMVSKALSASGPQAESRWAEIQRIFYNSGSWIVWGTPDFVDAHAPNVNGFTTNVLGPLGDYDFRKVWIA